MNTDGMTNLIGFMGHWIAIWPRRDPSVIYLSFCEGPDWEHTYAKIGIGIGKNNSGTPFYVDESTRIGAAFNVVIEAYNEKTYSRKPPINLPVAVEERLEEWCKERRFDFISFIKNKKRILCRVQTGGVEKRIVADSFITALAMALGFEIVQIEEMLALGSASNLDEIAVS